MNFRKTAAVMASLLIFTACGYSEAKNPSSSDASDTQAETSAPVIADTDILNFIPPEKGEKIAVMNVRDYGEVKIKLFPDACPKGVENFMGLCDMNYYDELIFHRVIPHFMDQGGDPRGNGTGGQSMWGGDFDGGISQGLYHFSGAVAYGNAGSTASDGSQFYIVNTAPGEVRDEEYIDQMGLPENVKALYKEKGGTPSLDGRYTIFGQVFEGYEIIQQIGQVETDDNDKPLKQVVMDSIRIVEYDG